VTKIRNTLSQAFAFAVKRDDLSRNVVEASTVPPAARRSVPRRSLSPDEARRLLGHLRTEPLGLLFALSLRIGLRPGEAAGLYWSDVDGNVVNVTRAVRRTGGRAVIADDLKTSSSKRTIEIPTELVEWFADHRRQQLAERLAAPRWADERLVFTGRTGDVLSPSTTRIALEDACQRAKVPKVTPNELRHSCASLLSDIGVPNEEIADLLGHTSTRMVDMHYRHRLRPIVDVAARADWTAAGP
jgi:integrase